MKRGNLFYPGCFADSFGYVAVSTQAKEQLTLFGLSLRQGILLGVCYQGLVLLRKLIPHNQLFLFLEDFGYLLAASLQILSFFYHKNLGDVTWYSILGMILGSYYVEEIRQIIVHIFHKIQMKKG